MGNGYEEDRNVNEKYFSELKNIPLQTIRNWRWSGKGPAYTKIPGTRSVRYSLQEIEAWWKRGHIKTRDTK